MVCLEDERGDVTDHLRSWTHDQTLARDRYQVVVASPGWDPDEDRAVAALLEPHDLLVNSQNTDLAGLLNDAAEAARAPWLLLTEAHCMGHPRCVEALADTLRREKGIEAATLEHGHVTPTAISESVSKWFDLVYQEWDQPGAWTRLNFVGYGIRRDVFIGEGGFPQRYGLFASKLISAKLAERDAPIVHVPQGLVNHVHHHVMEEHHENTTDYVRGECEARVDHDPRFFERYFGHRDLLWEKLTRSPRPARRLAGNLAVALGRALVRRTGDAGWLVRELPGRLLVALAPGARAAWDGAALAWEELAGDHFGLSAGRKLGLVLRAQDRAVRLAQLRWLRARQPELPPALDGRRREVVEMGFGELGGVHALEEQGGGPMRWTKPVSVVRVGPQGGGQLAIGTGGLRGAPLSYVSEVFVDGCRVPRRALAETGEELLVPLPASEATTEVTILSRPLEPGRSGSPDPRRLGMPLFSVALHPAA